MAIKELRRQLKFPDEVEFKFNKSRRVVKTAFLRTVVKFDFKVRCLVIDKKIIRSEELRNNRNSFYSYAIKTALAHTNSSVIDAKIKIDGSGDRVFRKNFLGYLRRQLNSKQRRIMKNCKLADSKSNVLIQMADMIAGSIRRSYEVSKSDCAVYKRIIKKHIEDEWKFR